MVYCINRTIVYNPDDGSLTLTDDTHQQCAGEIALTPTANRLLHILVSHQGSVLAREELLEHVWDNYGLKSSNNSLNQYISMLRRNFTDLGVEETAIVTVPRVGFMFSPELDVAAGAARLPSTPSAAAIATQGETPPVTRRTSPVRKSRALLILLALLTVANLGHAIYRYTTPDKAPYESRYLIGELAGCPVYSFYRSSQGSHHESLREIDQQMKQAALPCPSGSAIFYREQDTPEEQMTRIPFVAVCYPMTDGRYAKCRSSYSN